MFLIALLWCGGPSCEAAIKKIFGLQPQRSNPPARSVPVRKKNLPVNRHLHELQQLEREIEQENIRYIQLLMSLREVDKKIEDLETKISHNDQLIGQQRYQIKQILQQIVVGSIDEEDSSNFAQQSVLKIRAKELTAQEEKLQVESKRWKDSVVLLKNRLFEINSIIDELYEVLMVKDQKKLELKTQMTRAPQLPAKPSSQLLGERKIENKLMEKIAFVLPAKNYHSFKRQKMGAVVTLAENEPVVAMANGKIVYSGKLSTYGNVIMIDHGDDLRSVMFGDIKMLVNKGDIVQKGSPIAQNQLSDGQLYLEIRRHERVQELSNYLKF